MSTARKRTSFRAAQTSRFPDLALEHLPGSLPGRCPFMVVRIGKDMMPNAFHARNSLLQGGTTGMHMTGKVDKVGRKAKHFFRAIHWMNILSRGRPEVMGEQAIPKKVHGELSILETTK